MSEQKLESLAKFELTVENRLQVSGELSFKNVPELVLMSQKYFKNSDDLDVDLADVNRADSAGVALLIEWQRLAQKKEKSISFFNVPSQMMAIARLCGVDELLFLKN